MKKSELQKIIREELAKIEDKNLDLTKNLEKAVGLDKTDNSTPQNKPKEFELWLPSVDAGDATSILRSKEAVDNWVKEFREKFGEEPKLKKEGDKIVVTNPKFVEWRKTYQNTKSQWLDK